MKYDDIRDSLKDKGYKLTPQRRAIIETVFENQEKHLSSEDIYQLVKDKCPEMGLATVYRTLQLLDEIGVVYKLNFDDGCMRYELSSGKIDHHHHHHLVCLGCGEVFEVEVDLLEELEQEIERTQRFKITDHRLKFFGYCEGCQPSRLP